MKIKRKIIATIMLVILLSGNLLNLGTQVIAVSDSLFNQNSKTNIQNVEFNSYFEEENTHEKTFKTSEGGKLYIKVKVKESGYLKNGIIKIENANFKIDSSQIKSKYVQKIEEGTIYLNQIKSEEEVIIDVPITFIKNAKIDSDYFVKESKINFKANYINGNGKEKKVEKTVDNRVKWQSESEVEIKIEDKMIKYTPYHIGEEYGVIVQAQIKTGLKENKLPISKTKIEVEVPEIESQKPERVSVIASSLKATKNEENGNKFVSKNYSYNKEEEKVKIEVANEQVEGKINWGEGKDEYIITYVYTGKEVHDYIQEKLERAKAEKLTEEEIKAGQVNEEEITGQIAVEIETYNPEEAKLKVEGKITYNIEEEGKITDFIVTGKESISKAYIYANYDKQENKQETEYEVTYRTKVYDTNLNEGIEFQINNDKIVYRNEKYLSGNNTYINKIKISKENLIKMLGEEGKIEINKKDGVILGIITNEEVAYLDEKTGTYILNIEEKVSELVIKTTKPVSEGEIEITVEKAFVDEPEYTKDQIKEITKIETEAIAKTKTSEEILRKEIKLEELTNKVEISIKDENLSTVAENKDVQIRVVLDTSNLENALYKNPTLKIKLPSYISNVNLKSTDIIMNNGLKIKNVNIEKEGECLVIVAKLEGKQTDYTLGAEYKGTIIILNTDITVKTLTPTNENKIEMKYINENDVVKNKEGKVETRINFVAPMGVVAANAITNYATNAEKIMSISAEKQLVAELETYSSKKTATVTGTIINNYGNKVTNIRILGRLPSKDNKKIDSGENLGSTFDAVIKTEIKVKGLENYKVYYSNKVDANQNLEKVENEWTEKFSKEAKSYMIIADESYEMEEEKIIEFSYDIEIPENLSYNNSSYEMYKVYYTNASEIAKIDEEKESAILKVTTGEGPELDVKLTSKAEAIKEGQIIAMEVTVTNIGDTEVTGVGLNIPKPKYSSFVTYENTVGFSTLYVDNMEISLGTIMPKETRKETYYLRIDGNVPTENPELITKVTVKNDQIQNGIPSNEYRASIKKAKIRVELIGNIESSEAIKNGQRLTFRINVSKIKGQEELKDVIVTIPLLKEVLYKQAYIAQDDTKLTEGVTYNKDTHTLQVKLDSVNNIAKTIYIDVEGKSAKGKDSMMAVASMGEEEYYSNILEYEYSNVDMQISELISEPKYVKEGEAITYKFDIKNVGNTNATNINIKDILPEELLLTSLSYKLNGTTKKLTISSDNVAKITIPLIEVGKTANITIIAKAKSLKDVKEKQVQNNVSVEADYFDKVQTNTVTNIIEYNKELHENKTLKPSTGSTQTPNPSDYTYKIAGTAWLDENKDGRRNENEKLLSNIPVVLLNKMNNNVVTDLETNQPKRTVTSENGTYEFTNIPEGQYLVLFLYDAGGYSLTKYQTEGVEESLNSDAIDINIVFDGEKRLAGITDVIEITNSNVRNIDIGLYVVEKFDLRINKYISKITLTTPTIGTRTTNYNEESLAKVEILAKNVNKSNIIVEYKIKVTNEGKVAGYAKKIVDYLPEDCMFSSEINSDWYLSEGNKDIYTAKLANELIKPGESKEVTLVLSFNITDKNIGNIINNNAEIYESYNEQVNQDIDSVAGNKVSEEDDMSRADIVLSVVTGKLVIGSILIMVILAILVFGVYEIKRRVLAKR